MTGKFTYTSNTGQSVRWVPADADAAHQALADIDGTGVNTATEAKENAAVDLGRDMALVRAVLGEYAKQVAWKTHVNLEDGEVTAGGTDTETATITVKDSNGNAISEDVTAEVEVDGDVVQVQTASGEGVYEVTTTKPAGETLPIQVVGVEGHPSNASEEKFITVV